MASIIKRVDRGLPVRRLQHWDSQVDGIAMGDIIEVEQSLGHPAHRVSITMAGNSGSFRINPRVVVFHRRPKGEDGNYLSDWYDAVSSGFSYLDTSQTPVLVPAGTSYLLDDDLPVREIELVHSGGSSSFTVDAT